MSGSRLRVLGAAFAAVPGASATSSAVLSLIDALRADLDLVTVKTEELSHIKRIGDARMFRVPIGSGTLPQQRDVYVRALGRQLDADPYGIVHAFDAWAGAVAAERKRSRDYMLVYEIGAFPDPEEQDEDEWLDAHERALRAADRILVPTQVSSSVLEGRGLGERVEVIRPSVDVAAYDWSEVSRGGAPRLLYVGSCSPARDLETLLEALARVVGHRPVRALMAGEPDRARRHRLRQQIEALGLGDHVEVRGEPSAHRLLGLIAAADVCIVPAGERLVDGLAELPHPLLEHMACYRPVVVADVPGITEIVREEREGLLYPPSDASALADAILEVLRDGVLRERITEAGYRRVRDELGTGARRRRLAQIYEHLAPHTQLINPWGEPFEEVSTGLIELSTAAIDALRVDEAEEQAPHVDTAETLAPAAPAGEPTRPHIPRQAGLSTDTQPGLVLPDTDPGRR